MTLVQAALRHAEAGFDSSVARLRDLLRIPSVSTDPGYAGEVRRAGEWLVAELRDLGFEAGLRDTAGHPMLVAHHAGPGGDRVPHVLYYGHFDVQPPEPLELWNSPPFEPTIVEAERGKRLVARGAVDDKGQVMTFVEAFRAWREAHGSLPVRITVLLEGEEETGSPSLVPFLKANRDELLADVCIVTDTNSWDIDTPAITNRLRGLLFLEATITGPSHDLHSGLFGGAVPNPITVLTRILGQIHDDQGRVQFPGFYDDVKEPSAEELAQWRALDVDEKAFLAELGLTHGQGEAGRPMLERLWSRPACDINGIWGGYTGAGAKTVIPAHASVKLSCRLVPDQDPVKIDAGIRRFFEERLPPDCRVTFKRFGCSPGVEVPTDSPWMKAARRGLEEVYGRPAVLRGMGGSIPIVGYFKEHLGLDSILVGFGLEDDRIHSPNEKFELRCYANGIRSHIAILGQLAGLQRP